MSDEKRGAVMTAAEHASLRAVYDSWVAAEAAYRAALDDPEERPRAVHHAGCCEDDLDGALKAAAPALLESARLARLAAELFEQHGNAMANSLAARAREARDMHGAFAHAATLDRAHTALESTIAAFRKGAE